MTPASPRKLRLVADVAPAFVDAWRVEVWVSPDGSRPWLASSAIVDSTRAARVHATQAVSGLVVDGIESGRVFVGAILGRVPTETAGDLDPGWVPDPGETVEVAVVDDGERLGLWMHVPQQQWRARTQLPEATPPADSAQPAGGLA